MDENAEQPSRPGDLLSKYFGDLPKYQSTVKLDEAQVAKRKHISCHHYNMYLAEPHEQAYDPPEG